MMADMATTSEVTVKRHDMRTGFPTALAVAYALSIVELQMVERGALRALLPVGAVRPLGDRQYQTCRDKGNYKSGTNRVTDKFKQALKKFEEAGWVVRGSTYVRICDRAALSDYALARLPDPLPERFLAWNRGVAFLLDAEGVCSEAALEQRRRELLEYKRLMEQSFGHRHSGRGAVVAINKTRTI